MAIFFALFIIVPSAFAVYKEQVINKWLNDTAKASYNNDEFLLDLIKDNENAIVKDHKGELLGLVNGSCKLSDYYEICYAGARETGVYIKGDPVYEGHLNVSVLIADINITRVFKKTALSINEKTDAKITLDNDRGRAAVFYYFEQYPKEFQILEPKGCSAGENNSIIIEGQLDVISQKICSFAINPLGNITYNSIGSLSYFNGLKNITKKSAQVKLQVMPHHAQVQSNISKNLSVNKEYPVYFRIKNIYLNESIALSSAKITFPKEVYAKDSKGRIYELKWAGQLEKNESKDFNVILTPEKIGAADISYEIRYRINSIDNINAGSISINTLYSRPEFYLDIDKLNISGSEKALLTLGILNGEYEFKDVEIQITSPLFNHSERIETIDSSFKGRVFSKEIVAPKLANNTKIDFNLNITYQTRDDEKLSYNDKKSIFILKSDAASAKAPAGAEGSKTSAIKNIIKNLFAKTNLNFNLQIVIFILVDCLILAGIIFLFRYVTRKY